MCVYKCLCVSMCMFVLVFLSECVCFSMFLVCLPIIFKMCHCVYYCEFMSINVYVCVFMCNWLECVCQVYMYMSSVCEFGYVFACMFCVC